jgi:hypothetical protein
MLELKTTYHATCDRCGKEERFEDSSPKEFFNVRFSSSFTDGEQGIWQKGLVCKACYQDFIELAESFLDGLNKGEQA